MDDQKPKQICEQCKQGLEFAYNLRKLGEANERRLQNQIQINDADLVVEALDDDEIENAEVENSNSAEESESPEFLDDDDNVIIQFNGRIFKCDQGEISEEGDYVYEVLDGEEVYEEAEEILPHASDEILQEETVTEEVECYSNQEEVEEEIVDDANAGKMIQPMSRV